MTLAEELAAVPPAEAELLDLEAALEELAEVDPRQVQLVELRFFGGVTIEEAARCLEVSVTTANRDWAMAKSWLYRRLQQMKNGKR